MTVAKKLVVQPLLYGQEAGTVRLELPSDWDGPAGVVVEVDPHNTHTLLAIVLSAIREAGDLEAIEDRADDLLLHAWSDVVTDPLALSYGMGVDSTAVLVGWWQRGIRPDWIGHAQVGNEWPETYAYRPIIDEWLDRVGFPAITEVQYVLKRGKNGHYTTLEENCLVNKTLPSLAFGGRKGCSLKWKGQPLDTACGKHFSAHIKAGGKVRRAIGYDAGPCDMRRGAGESKGPWNWIYPLREWGWDRERCIAEILAAGLSVPPKSACWYCPSTKPAELIQLARRHPDLARRAVVMEDLARPRLIKIEGLWGKGVKGTRGGEKKPGSWRVFLAEHAPEVLPELPVVEIKGAE